MGKDCDLVYVVILQGKRMQTLEATASETFVSNSESLNQLI